MTQKIWIKFIVFLTLLVGSLTSSFVLAQENDDIDGFIEAAGGNNPVTLNTFELRKSSGTKIESGTSSIDPTFDYSMHLDINDADGFSNITSVTFKFFNLDRPESDIRRAFDGYTSTGIRDIDSANYPDFMLSDDAFIVQWTKASDAFTMVGGNSTTWQLSEGAITHIAANQFTFDVDFKVSKIALNNDAWYIGALVIDGDGNETATENFFTDGSFGVNWYGELQIDQNAMVKWDAVDAGTDFDGPNSTTTIKHATTGAIQDITYISNGYYQQRIYSSSQWAPLEDIPLQDETGRFAFLTTQSAQSAFDPQQFGIGVALDYDDASVNTRLTTTPITLRGHQLDTTTYNPTIWRARTTEAGITFTDLIFRVSVADIFQNATYEGSITLGISNETDILTASQAQSIATSGGILTSQSAVGVYATTEEELVALLSNDGIQVPIYLKNGFIELTTAPAISISNTALKPVIGNVFITGENISISGLTLLYGDLHIEGNDTLLTRTNIMSHSPGGDLYVKAKNFTGANINIEGSVYVSNSASGIISQDTETMSANSDYRIEGNVFVSEQSTFTVDNLYLFIPTVGQGNIHVTGNSIITLKNNTSFENLIMTNSTGYLIGDTDITGSSHGVSGDKSRPIGYSMKLTNSTVTQTAASFTSVNLYESSTLTKDSGWADITKLFDQSQLNFNGGEITQLNNHDQSHVEMTGGFVHDDFNNFGSTADISGGKIGLDYFSSSNLNSPTDTHGLFLDATNTTMTTPSTITISGDTEILHILAKQNATISMAGSSRIYRVTDLQDNVAFTFSGGIMQYVRMFDDATLTMTGSGANLYKAHIFNDSYLSVSNGTVGYGNSNESLVSINDTARFEMTGGALDLGSVSDTKVDEDFVDTSGDSRSDTTVSTTSSNEKRGLSIRDDAIVTLSGLTISSTTELELRDNGSLTMNTTLPFFRMVKDYVSVFNENDFETSNINHTHLSLIEIYVKPDENGAATRPTRQDAVGETNIAFDFTTIEEKDSNNNSAFIEARRLSDNFDHKVNVYLVDGVYNESELLKMDRSDLKLMFTPEGRTDLVTSSRKSGDGGKKAILNQGVLVTEDDTLIHGIDFDLTTQNITVNNSGAAVEVINNSITQSQSTQSVVDLTAKEFSLKGNYISRPSESTNTSVAITIESAAQSSTIRDNTIDNIQNHAIDIRQTGDNYANRLSLISNNIGSASRPIDGNAIRFVSGGYKQLFTNNNTIQNISDTAILFMDIVLDDYIQFTSDTIFDIQNGHAIHFTYQVTFGANYDYIEFLELSLQTSETGGHGIFFDQLEVVENILLRDSQSDDDSYENLDSALRIEGATTISGITMDSLRVKNLREDAFYLQGNTIEDITFTHDPNKTNGHEISQGIFSIDDVKRGRIENVSKAGVYLEGTSLDGFAMNGFVIDQFATAGKDHAGIDFNVSNISGMLINQAIFRKDIQSQGFTFDDYYAIQTEFTNGLGPALRFYLDDANIYSENQLFNPLIQNNAIGIEFKGTLSDGNAIDTLFNSTEFSLTNGLTNRNFRVNASLNGHSLDLFVRQVSGLTLNPSPGTIINETAAGLKNNTIEIIDETFTIDFEEFRSLYGRLAYDANANPLLIAENVTNQSLQALPVLTTSAISMPGFEAIITFEDERTPPRIRTDYYVDEDGQTILSSDLDILRDTNGNLNLLIDAPTGATRATIYLETITLDGSGVVVSTNLVSQTSIVSGGTITVSVPIATASGAGFVTLFTNPSTTKYQAQIDFFDASDALISQSGLVLDTLIYTDSNFADQLSTWSGSQPNLNFLIPALDNVLKSTIDNSISETAFYMNLTNNYQRINNPVYADFLELFAEVNTYEKALVDSLAFINNVGNNTEAAFLHEDDVKFDTTFIGTVVMALSGTGIVQPYDFGNFDSVNTADTIARLTAQPNVKEHRWIIDDLIAERPFADYFTMISVLEPIMNSIDGLEIMPEIFTLTMSPTALFVVTGTDLSVIQGYFNSDSLYPIYYDIEYIGNVPVTVTAIETLVQVDDWDTVDGTWNTVKETGGFYQFVSTYRFGDNSNYVFDFDRSITLKAISVSVSTIQLNDPIAGVSLNQTGLDQSLNIQFEVDDLDDETILGTSIDDLEGVNGEVTLQAYAPINATRAHVRIIYGGSETGQTVSVVDNSFTFTLDLAQKVGNDWKVLDDTLSYTIQVSYSHDNYDLTYDLDVELEYVLADFIDSINAAPSGSELEALLSTQRTSLIDNSSVVNTGYYNALYTNVTANTLTTFGEFTTLFNDLLAYEEAMLDAISYAMAVTSETTINLNTLILDVNNALAGSSILRVYGDTQDASQKMSNLAALQTDLGKVLDQSLISEALSATNTGITSYDILQARLRVMADDLVVASVDGVTYYSFQEAINKGSYPTPIKLLASTKEDIVLASAIQTIDFNGFTLDGDFTIELENMMITVNLTGQGIITGDFTAGDESVGVITDLTVQGLTIIKEITNAVNKSFFTTGIHKGGIRLDGPGRINALNQSNPPSITVNTTDTVQIDGYVSEVSINVANANLTVNAAVNKINLNNHPINLTLGQDASIASGRVVKNETTNVYFQTIQGAIDAATSGDTLLIFQGTYIEDITIDKSLTLSGINQGVSYDATRDDESYISGSSVTFTAEDITIDGMAFMNTYIKRFSTEANGLSILNTIIEHTYVLDAYIEMVDNHGDRYMLKGYGGVSNVSIENTHLIGPGKDALATNAAFSALVTPSQFFIGGIDLNQVHDSTVSGVKVEEVSRYSLSINNTSTGILIHDYTVLNAGHSENDFMAALELFKPSQNSEYTVSGSFDFENVSVGIDIRAISETHLNVASGFDLTVSGVGIDIYGINTSSASISDDALAKSLGATVRLQADGVSDDANTNTLVIASGVDNLALYYIIDPFPADPTTLITVDFGPDGPKDVTYAKTDLTE